MHYRGRFKERLHCFAIRLRKDRSELKHAYYSGDTLVEELTVQEGEGGGN